MRTTLTLEEDVAAKLKSLMRRTGKSFKDTVNTTLRAGLNRGSAPRPQKPFRVEARDLGELKPGLNLDNIGELLERTEGPQRR